MGLLITEDDFSGKWELAKSNSDLIGEYIEEYEEKFLIELLGKELFDLFKADLTGYVADISVGVPSNPIYTKIFLPFTEKINLCVVTSDGMKKMLLGLIYFNYVRDNRIKQTMNGAVEQQTEVSIPSDNTFLYLRYNTAVKTYNAIQVYVYENRTLVYPTFYGVTKKITSFI